MVNDDIRQFIALVKEETDKDEDFVLDRVRATELYVKLSEQYDNVDELVERAMHAGSSYGRMRELLESVERQKSHLVVREREKYTSEAGMMLWGAKMLGPEIFEKFVWRHGGTAAAAALAREVFDSVRDGDGNYVGKKEETDNRKKR